MQKNKVLSFSINKFNAFIELDNEDIKIIFSGDIDFRNTKTLTFYFLEIHDAIVSRNIKNITIDLIDLMFVNSSGISAIVKWLLAAEDRCLKNNYKVTVIYDNAENWKENFLKVINQIFKFIVLKNIENKENN